MANLSKIKRDKMIAFLEELKKTQTDDDKIRAFNEIENHLREKKYGLVWEEHSEEVDELLKENIPILTADPDRRLCKDKDLPWNFIIEGDNLQALYLLEKTHKGKIDCIYIDPPYNSGATDWKYNNNYVGREDVYRHSKWLSMMKSRLLLAKHLLNPEDSVLIVTIDEKEYLRLGCLLEEMFPTAKIQMVSSVINSKGVARDEFFRVNEYLYIVRLGACCPSVLPLPDEWLGNIQTSTTKKVRWGSLMRSGSGSLRSDSPGCFYPIFVTEDKKHFCGAGEVVPVGVDRNTVKVPEGQIAIFPVHNDGTEGRWQYSRDKFLEIQKKGYVRISTKTRSGITLRYIAEGWQKRVENGQVKVVGRAEDGSLIFNDEDYVQEYIPSNQWWIPSHNATEFGSKLLKKIIGKRFSFPKSLYAVHDVIRFFLSNKPNAVVLDFFAGSGTTQHAVNLLNASDGGTRRCIMVTNNEISAEEEKEFTKKGYKKGDPEWESFGIAKYVTWPRTVCSIQGQDINDNPLKGDYLVNDKYGNPIPMSIGFPCNVKYFKCDWTPRKPVDYLLSNVLCLHIREMIELQNAIEIDNIKNVIILNKNDFKRTVQNVEIYPQIENVWVNQNIIFNSYELKLLKTVGFKYIPREFFGQELKEAAE
ncbi:site-specific DNA-methyltransferase [Faecalitalea cylindroides]|uniref:site-specific DNA-methyltransferase n=1 Tax=Faecalitalea cylindroides TaxID=39483 RepID=UPI000B39560E|nr:DNA methyltransferase [Faecalitalea cylindroides]OUN62872.1 site-specific DNA-methyltransferase [Faecalitalea cylindroides]